LAAAGPRASIDDPGAYSAVAEDARALPVLITGDVTGLQDDTPIAVAVDGRIQATTRVFREGGRAQYVALVAPESLRPGSHTVALLDVLPGDRLRTIGAVPAIGR
jgi:archaellum component FlaG (FlaF/FlaG flagellin family)